MKLVILFICGIVIFVLWAQCEAHISINIDSDDFDHVTDFLHEVMHNQPTTPIPSNRQIVRFIQNGIVSTIHLLGVVAALVGANIISSNLIEDRATVIQQPKIVTNISSVYNRKNGETCKIEYGCFESVCWRTCNNSDGKKWCFTSPKINGREYHHCNVSADCSICWECIEQCHD